MAANNTPDRSNRVVWAGLAILGIVLAVAGWYHFFIR